MLTEFQMAALTLLTDAKERILFQIRVNEYTNKIVMFVAAWCGV
jgi:hypothetical protein